MLFTHIFFKNNFGSKGELGDDVLVVIKVAIEGVVFGRNIYAIVLLYAKPLVFDVQTVDFKGMSLYSVFLALIFAADDKAALDVVREGSVTKRLKA